jgi:hypothetical protein
MAQDQQQQQQKRNDEPQRAHEQAPKERIYRVTQEIKIPRGGSHYLLPAGKTLSSHGYDIPALKRLGVQLEEVGA